MIKTYKYPLLLLLVGMIIVPLIALQMVYIYASGIVHEPGVRLMPLVPLSILVSLVWMVRIRLKTRVS